jgi:hypothetical protein
LVNKNLVNSAKGVRLGRSEVFCYVLAKAQAMEEALG